MLKLKRITDVYEMKVFDDLGNYMGDIEEAILTANKIFGWRIRATKSSSLNRILGGAKGVIVPHRFVKAIGDIMVVSKQAIPDYENEEAPQQQAVRQEQISSGPTDPRLF